MFKLRALGRAAASRAQFLAPGALLFVSASAAAGGKGTKASPYKTFAEAAASVSVKRVYACAETYNETKAVSFSGGIEVYAGFGDCTADTGWTWAAASLATL